MKTTPLCGVVFAFLTGLTVASLSAQAPFNPFNVQQPIDTSGPNGANLNFGESPDHRSAVDGEPYSLTFTIDKDGNISPRVLSWSLLRYSVTFFPTEDGAAKPVFAGQREAIKRIAPPAEAAPFIAEPFYPHLTTLWAHHKVSRGLEKRLTAYRQSRDNAALKIRTKVSALQSLDTAAAAQAWAQFEATESADWAEIEKERANLLSRLQNGGLWHGGVSMEDIQDLAIMAVSEPDSAQFVHLRTLRHFAPELSIEQRDLIGEILIELSTPEELGLTSGTVLVSASGKRLTLPDKMTMASAETLAAYLATKAELKQELLDALVPVMRQPGTDREFAKTANQLRIDQAPKFDRLSEQLRALAIALQLKAITENASPADTLQLTNSGSAFDLEALALLSNPQRQLLASSAITY